MGLLVVLLLMSHCVYWTAGDHGAVFSKDDIENYRREHGIHTTTPPVLLQTLTPNSKMENGQEVFYCEYKGVKFAVGTDFKDMDQCTRVQCSPNQFRIQRQPKVRYTPEHEDFQKCKWIQAGCKRHWVLANKPRRKCPFSGVFRLYSPFTFPMPMTVSAVKPE